VWNTVQTCTRYAIESGSTGLIPMIEIRNNSKLSNIKSDKYVPLNYLFDTKVFAERLQESCPKMKLYNDITEVPDFGYASMPPVLDTKAVSIEGTSQKLDPPYKTKNSMSNLAVYLEARQLIHNSRKCRTISVTIRYMAEPK